MSEQDKAGFRNLCDRIFVAAKLFESMIGHMPVYVNVSIVDWITIQGNFTAKAKAGDKFSIFSHKAEDKLSIRIRVAVRPSIFCYCTDDMMELKRPGIGVFR